MVKAVQEEMMGKRGRVEQKELKEIRKERRKQDMTITDMTLKRKEETQVSDGNERWIRDANLKEIKKGDTNETRTVIYKLRKGSNNRC